MQDIKAVSHFVDKPHSQKVNIWGLRFFINACREKSLFHSFRYTAGDQETWFPTSHPKDKSSPKQKTSKILLLPHKNQPLTKCSGHSFPDQKKVSALLPVASQTPRGTTANKLPCNLQGIWSQQRWVPPWPAASQLSQAHGAAWTPLLLRFPCQSCRSMNSS